jgi:acetate kinase
MKPANQRILTINGGSSSIKFALFEAGDSLRRILEGRIERIGLPEATFRVRGLNQADNFSRLVTAPDHTVAVGALMDWIEERTGHDALTAVGHRVMHGGPKYSKPQLITAEMVEELHRLSPFDPEHLPEEILLTEAFHRRFPALPQVACFDTAFHHDLPRVARLLPIRRRYEAPVWISRIIVCVSNGRTGPLGRIRSDTRPDHPRPSRQWREPGGGA